MKKTLIATLLVLAMMVSGLSVLAAAAEAPVPPTQAEDGGIAPHTEETVWYTRVHNGVLQKRLWSITYGRWLTDWIDVG